MLQILISLSLRNGINANAKSRFIMLPLLGLRAQVMHCILTFKNL